jgi:Flp pilus assembly pilin Flp
MGRLNVVSDYLRAFASDQRGAAAAEYVMLLALITGTIAMAIFSLSGAIAGGIEDAAELIAEWIDKANCNNQGQGTGLGGGQGGGGGQGAGSGTGNTC